MVVQEKYRQDYNIFVRHSLAIKYYGGFRNWKPLFDVAGISLSDKEIDYTRWLNHISVRISDSNEFFENDLTNGVFRVKTNRKEVIASLRFDIKTLTVTECSELIRLFWLLSQVFKNILK